MKFPFVHVLLFLIAVLFGVFLGYMAWEWMGNATPSTAPAAVVIQEQAGIPPVAEPEPPVPISPAVLDEMPPVVLSPAPASPVPEVKTDLKKTQFVVMAFDGSYDIEMWKKTRAFAAAEALVGAPIHFTYFINAAYLLTPSNKDLYHPPRHEVGTSAISFAYNEKDVANRVEQMNLALSEGHEIGSHSVGHWDGTDWTQEEWTSELTQFNSFVDHVGENNHLEKEPLIRRQLSIPAASIIGFRAPELGRGPPLWKALAALGFRYDTSRTTKSLAWPTKDEDGLWSFPLSRIDYPGVDKPLLAMDYNFYFRQTEAKDTLKKGTPEWQKAHDDMLNAYLTYFQTHADGERAPVYIGHHFSLWNDGAYWEALKDFATAVCGKPDVKCVSFKELADNLDASSRK